MCGVYDWLEELNEEKRMKSVKLHRFIISTLLSFITLTTFSFNGLAAEEYGFERTWPVLEQPWYFVTPRDVAIDNNGNVYVADSYNWRIQKFSSSGAFITKWGSSGWGDGQLDSPSGIAVDSDRNVYVADWGYGCGHRNRIGLS